MSLRFELEYAGLAGVAAVMRALPRPLALEAGATVGALGWLLRIRRRLVLANLAQALPHLTTHERSRLAALAARNFGRTVAEFVRFAGRDRRRVAELVALEGEESLRAVLAGGSGAIVVTAHLGSWALYVTALAAAGIPAALLVGKQHNPKVDAFILEIPGDAVRFISKGPQAPRGVLSTLREGRAVVLVADQHTHHGGHLVPFLARPARTLSLPAAIAARHQTPLFLLAGHRVGHGRHRVRITPLALPAPGEAPEAITAGINVALGEAILAHADQYFWYHRRWRDDPVLARRSD